MKNLEKDVNLQEMSLQEMRDANGGFDIGLAIALATVCIYVYNEGSDFIDGFKEGYQNARN